MDKKMTTLEISLAALSKNPKPSKRFENITIQIKKKESDQTVDETRLKRDKLWSELSNQVVGAEHLKG